MKVNILFVYEKDILRSLVFLFFTNFAFAQTAQSFHLQGKSLSQGKGKYIYLTYPDINDRWVKDSSLVEEGNFIFMGRISYPTVARVSYAKSWTEIILEPATMDMSINEAGDLSTAKIAGSKSQNELSELNAEIQQVNLRWKIVMDTLTAVNKRSNAAFQELKGWVLDPYFKGMEEINHRFINKYPLSFTSAHILHVFARELATDTLELFYNRFPRQVRQSRYGMAVAKQLANRKMASPGTLAPVFTKQDIDGKNLSLESLKGKYVLLDFWGSWCIPCRKGNPHLISLYSKYKRFGFEIIGIAADDKTQQAWRKAVEDDKLPWLQVLQGSLNREYNVSSYPTKILIDKKGNILGRFGEQQDKLDGMLEKIFRVDE